MLIRTLLAVGPTDRVLDLACGHGRHARALAPEVGVLVGLDRNPEYLARARESGAHLVRGDLRALPFRPAAFDALYSWYSSLFMYGDGENLRVLAAAARLLRPGGRMVVHHDNPLRLARQAEARTAWDLSAGGRVEETSHFDPSTGVDVCERRLTRRDGTELAGTARLRYYRPEEWEALAPRAGLRLLRITSTFQADDPTQRLDDDAPDLIALSEKV